MTDIPNTAPVVLAYPDSGDAPQGRTLAGGNNIQIEDNGPGNNLTITPINNLASLASFDGPGFPYQNTPNTFETYNISAINPSIVVNTNTGTKEIELKVANNTTYQQVRLENNGSGITSSRSVLNLIPGPGMGITITDNGSLDRADITFTSTGGSSSDPDGTYILQTPDSRMPLAQSLSLLNSGVLLNTTGTGVLTSTGLGTNGQFLQTDGTSISWADSNAGDGDAKYIIQQPDVSLPNAQSLSGLSTGVLFNTTSTGVLSSLGIGSNNQVLTNSGGSVGWQTLPASNITTLLSIADFGPTTGLDSTGVTPSNPFGTSVYVEYPLNTGPFRDVLNGIGSPPSEATLIFNFNGSYFAAGGSTNENVYIQYWVGTDQVVGQPYGDLSFTVPLSTSPNSAQVTQNTYAMYDYSNGNGNGNYPLVLSIPVLLSDIVNPSNATIRVYFQIVNDNSSTGPQNGSLLYNSPILTATYYPNGF